MQRKDAEENIESLTELHFIRRLKKNRTHFNGNLSILAVDDEEGDDQDVYVVSIPGNEKITLQVTEERTLHATLTEMKLVVEQKRLVFS